MTIAKEAQHKLEVEIYQLRHEGGLRSLHAWLAGRRDYVNRKWPHAVGNELVAYQGEARTLDRLIHLIEAGPAIKEVKE